MTVKLKVDQIWRHNKRGSDYRVVNTGILIQCSTYQIVEDVISDQPWVTYASLKDGKVCSRLESEFTDGRFTLISSHWAEDMDALP